MMMDKIVFATNNEHKLREIRAILRDEIEVFSLEDIGCHADIAETADTLEGNALIKARFVYDNYHMDCFADDTGLEVEALNGEPGVRTARYAGDNHDSKANMRKLLHEMDGKTNRYARFRTAIALVQDGEEYLFSGEVRGDISTEPRGEQGFGYDPVFIPENAGKTFAELGEEAKNGISHRARAVKKLVDFFYRQAGVSDQHNRV